jgi:hypothetical protein
MTVGVSGMMGPTNVLEIRCCWYWYQEIRGFEVVPVEESVRYPRSEHLQGVSLVASDELGWPWDRGAGPFGP